MKGVTRAPKSKMLATEENGNTINKAVAANLSKKKKNNKKKKL